MLGITKETNLYKELEAIGLTNENGTIKGQALIDERARRISERKKATSEQAAKSKKKKLDGYTEEQYNNFGWVSYNEVITPKEREILLSRYADFKHNRHKYPVTVWGDAVIHSTDCPDVIMYISGDIDSPKISKIVRIIADDSADILAIKERILINENEQVSLPYKTITECYEPGVLEFHRKRDYASFRSLLAGEERGNSESGNTSGGAEQDRDGSVYEDKGNGSAGLEDKSAISMPEASENDNQSSEKDNKDSEEVHADSDVQKDNYKKDDSFWTAEDKNDPTVSKGLKNKLRSLFGKSGSENSVNSISEIVKQIEKDFGVPISTGRFKQKAYGIYKNRAEAIRTKVSNALPTIAHEIGHHLDKRYKLSKLSSISEAVDVLKNSRPDFFKAYSAENRPHEAVAEFIRIYLADRTLAKNNYPKFFVDFENALSSTKNTENNGSKDLENLKAIGDMINRYYTSEKAERARAAVISRTETSSKGYK